MRNTSKGTTVQNSILIIGDQSAFSASLIQFLRGHAESVESDQSVKPGHAFQVVIRAQARLLLADMRKVSRTWIELIKQVKAASPQTKVLVSCSREDAVSANRVLRAGADGYILRDESGDEIMNAIRDVLAGVLYVSESVLAVSSKSRQAAGSNNRGCPSAKVDTSDFWNPGRWTRATLKSSVVSA